MLVWRWFWEIRLEQQHAASYKPRESFCSHMVFIFSALFERYNTKRVYTVDQKNVQKLIFLCFFCEFCIFLLLCEYVWVITFRKWTSRWQKRCVKFFRHVDINILRFWCFWVNFSENFFPFFWWILYQNRFFGQKYVDWGLTSGERKYSVDPGGYFVRLELVLNRRIFWDFGVFEAILAKWRHL